MVAMSQLNERELGATLQQGGDHRKLSATKDGRRLSSERVKTHG